MSNTIQWDLSMTLMGLFWVIFCLIKYKEAKLISAWGEFSVLMPTSEKYFWSEPSTDSLGVWGLCIAS